MIFDSGTDNQLLTTGRAKKKAEVLKGDIRGLIIPALKEIRHELIDALDTLRQQVLSVQDEIEESGAFITP